MKNFALFVQSTLLALALALAAPGCASNEPEAPPAEGAVDEPETTALEGEASLLSCSSVYYCAVCPTDGFTRCSSPKPGAAASACNAHCAEVCIVDAYCD